MSNILPDHPSTPDGTRPPHRRIRHRRRYTPVVIQTSDPGALVCVDVLPAPGTAWVVLHALDLTTAVLLTPAQARQTAEAVRDATEVTTGVCWTHVGPVVTLDTPPVEMPALSVWGVDTGTVRVAVEQTHPAGWTLPPASAAVLADALDAAATRCERAR